MSESLIKFAFVQTFGGRKEENDRNNKQAFVDAEYSQHSWWELLAVTLAPEFFFHLRRGLEQSGAHVPSNYVIDDSNL